MNKLPQNVVKFAGEQQKVYVQFQDYFAHYMDETQNRNIGIYDKSVSFANKEQKMHEALVTEVKRHSGVNFSSEIPVQQWANNPMVTWATFAVVSNLIDAIIPQTINKSLGLYTEIRNIGYGDTALFDVKPKSLFVVSKGGNAQRMGLVNKQFGTTETLIPENHIITVGVSLYKVLSGKESLAEFTRKAILSIEHEMSLDAYRALTTGLDTAVVPTDLKVTGYTQNDLVTLCERVTAYNNGAKAVIVGSTNALANILPNQANGYRILTQGNNMSIQLIKTFFDYDILRIPQFAKVNDNFKLALDDTKLYVMSPSSDKLIKGVIEGSTLSHVDGTYDSANLTQDATFTKRWVFGFLTNAIAGVMTV